mmetsp:Transcript_39965/g.95378  ORF Transcript_39965/g.95378 Transcript_39965/m.95378 type:complete len:798 (+) Transcript_39965:103-2496(+)|eukprot:CAMPEP_0181443492 /NCGR_PEP_ID=MMETSP1110-20121109/24582_1 /TAXON_ID=174948 /ORGANISM="Symbiodinium sp., Strain CCMP421" /LENGTH=797 /DNA_ID=CAMNT_0023567471 /DNA_START=98 /DNA_END=2491 /DNA_ORIENTATION=+
MLHFEVQCETVPGELVAVCGSGVLGDWEVAASLELDPRDYPVWKGNVESDEPLEFKYLKVSTQGGERRLLQWEGDFPNRRVECGKHKQIVKHRWADPSYECLELLSNEGGEEQKSHKAPECQGTEQPQGAENKEEPQEGERTPLLLPLGVQRLGSGILADIPVDPAVRLARMVRSRSGKFTENYELLPSTVLGTGMTGGVVVGKNKETGVEVAVKTLSLDGMNITHIKAEVQHQLAMDHPNICRLLEVYEEPTRLLLVMEKLNGPDLFDALSKKRRYTEKDAVEVVRQICSAVAYCHRNGVCHRDLKLENFCLEDDSENARIKMIDFGLAHKIDSELPMTDSCGTLYYAAPEVLRGNYNERCDMWSMGVLTYILLDGRAPFMGRDDRRTYRLILQGNFEFPDARWSNVSQEAKDFVSNLLQVDPSKRLTAEEALAHPWLATTPSETTVELDAEVLSGLKTFTRGNEVKRAVLKALAPVASVEQVGRWADQFEALDESGTGYIKVSDLVARLSQQGHSEGQAESIAQALKLAAGNTQEISYSAFLAACLCAHHSHLEEKHLRELFSKLDKEKTGKVTAAQVSKAFGGILDMEALDSELGGRALSFSDFCWLLQRPLAPSNMVGLRQLLGAFEGLGLAKSWRVDTVRAKAGDESFEAARRENAAWRLWHRQRLQSEAEDGSVDVPPVTVIAAPGYPNDGSSTVVSPPMKDNMAHLASPSLKPALGPDLLLSTSSIPPSQTPSQQPSRPSSQSSHDDLDKKEELQATWAVATAEAKDGDIEAARRENRAWRLMNMSAAPA